MAVKDKIKALLSRIIVLEGLFVELPGNAAEERRRKELFRYVIVSHTDQALISFQ